jgi:hypothetical protein
MRIEAVRREVTSSGTMEVATATIKATPKIFDMFANDTYANKPLAIMRELASNAIDAHKAAGREDRPIEIILPSPLEPMCVVRDFGTGMPHEFVMGPFMAYTDGSTKDNNDDAIGGFGIGSKSPFSYVDQFTLRVVHEGVLSVYTMFKNEDGIPAIGLQGQTTTDEPNGVEVSFPVEDKDMEAFSEAAQQALQYFRPLPLVTNGTLNAPDYSYTGTNWAMRGTAGDLGVIMGGVRYPVSESSLSYELRNDKQISPLLKYGIDITLPIGSCGVAMSREQLSYVPKTSTSIAAGLKAILKDVVDTFSTFFDKAPNEWTAMKQLVEQTGMNSYQRNARAQLLLANAFYKGKKLETGFKLHDAYLPGTKAWLVQPKSSRRGVNVPPPKWVTVGDVYTITPGQVEKIIIDDLPHSPKSKSNLKIRDFIATLPQTSHTFVFRPSEAAGELTKLIGALRGCDDYVLTSTLPEPVAVSKATGLVRPRVRMFTYDGGSDAYTGRKINNLSPALSKKDRVKEIKYADQPATGILVTMTSFDLPHDLHKKMDTGLVAWKDLSFVNAIDAPKLKATFRNFDEVWQERFDAKIKQWPNLGESLAVYQDGILSAEFIRWRKVLAGHPKGRAVIPPAARKRPFGKIITLFEEHILPLTDEQKRMAPFVKMALPKGLDLGKLRAEFLRQTDAWILWNALRVETDNSHLDLFLRNI